MTVAPDEARRAADAAVERARLALARLEPAAPPHEADAKPAGVLIPLQRRCGEWRVILNVRSQNVGLHQGEIAFPGGKREEGDADIWACALREAQEEMGVAPEDVEALGRMHPVLTRTDYLVWPIVGVIPHPYPFVVDENEVAEVVEIPLAHLLAPEAARHEARLMPDGTLLRREAYAYGRYLVFGATAWILGQFLDLARQETSGDLARQEASGDLARQEASGDLAPQETNEDLARSEASE